MTNFSVEASSLLAWYDKHGRELPWRMKDGIIPDPYRIWVSEMMLQQTTVATVIPYFQNFMQRWPTLQDLAVASLDDILHGWQGLGYYSRARNLHRCAREIVEKWDGSFPTDESHLLKLPGIGPYTAAALTTIAFNKSAVAIDGNIVRVFSRYYALDAKGPALKEAVRQASSQILPPKRVGDYTQALMDLGATICRPRQPLCTACPWESRCLAFAQNRVSDFPPPSEKKPLPHRHGLVFWSERTDGTVLLHQKEEKGLLGGLMAFPSTPWKEDPFQKEIGHLPAPGEWAALPETVNHTFTHFKLFLTVWMGKISTPAGSTEGLWVKPENFGDYAFSTLMKKVTAYVLKSSL